MSTRYPVRCRRMRAALQESVDRHAPVPAEAATHLADCAECRRFHTGLMRLGQEIRLAVAPPYVRPRDPAECFGALPGVQAPVRDQAGRPVPHRSAWPRLAWRRPAWTAIGATVVLTVAIAAGIRIQSARVGRAETAEEMGAFVGRLYDQSALDGIEYSPVSFLDDVQSLPDWLSRTAR